MCVAHHIRTADKSHVVSVGTGLLTYGPIQKSHTDFCCSQKKDANIWQVVKDCCSPPQEKERESSQAMGRRVQNVDSAVRKS